MTTYSDPIVIKGRYQIVAVVADGEDDLDQILGYAVTTSDGGRLRHAPSVDTACAWMDQRLQEDLVQPPVAERPPARPRRIRR